MKVCGKCKNTKSLDDFGWRNKEKGSRQWACRDCQKELRREHHVKNQKKNLTRVKARRQKITDKIWAYKSTHPCVDCGRTNPAGLTFDHLPQFEKSFDISTAAQRGFSWDKIEKEINKCEVVCGYCHGIRTHTRGGWVRNVAINAGIV